MKVLYGNWKTTTFIAALRHDRVSAPFVLEGAMNGETFRAYVEHILVPTLRPGDIVVLDNLSSHKDKPAIALMEQAGAEVRFLPPYSPDFNPIEKMWSKVKALLRSAKARTEATLLAAIGAALAEVTAQNAEGWFASCGYSII